MKADAFQVLLELWSSASDNVRIAAFLAVRKLFVGGDDAIRDICLKVSSIPVRPHLGDTPCWDLQRHLLWRCSTDRGDDTESPGNVSLPPRSSAQYHPSHPSLSEPAQEHRLRTLPPRPCPVISSSIYGHPDAGCASQRLHSRRHSSAVHLETGCCRRRRRRGWCREIRPARGVPESL